MRTKTKKTTQIERDRPVEIGLGIKRARQILNGLMDLEVHSRELPYLTVLAFFDGMLEDDDRLPAEDQTKYVDAFKFAIAVTRQEGGEEAAKDAATVIETFDRLFETNKENDE